MVAGQEGAALHTMAVLQVYQADLLKDMDEGKGLKPEDVKELCRATDLAIQSTKQIACSMGCSMAGLRVTERHLWLNICCFINKVQK